jgi:dihydrodipicolinate synthase/N-acetylneuraminate lyase
MLCRLLPGAQRTIVQVKEAAGNGADGMLAAIPQYFPLDQGGLIRHYQKVADASSLPVAM